MLGVDTIITKNTHENGVKFPEERNAFVLDHQHGCSVLTCKPAVEANVEGGGWFFG